MDVRVDRANTCPQAERLLAIGKARVIRMSLAAQGHLVTCVASDKALSALQTRRYQAAILSPESFPLAQTLHQSDPALGFIFLQQPGASLGQDLPPTCIRVSVALPLRPGELERATQDLLARRRLMRDSRRFRALMPILKAIEGLPSETLLGRSFRSVVQTAAKETGADQISLLLLEGEELVSVAAVGPSEAALPRIRLGEGLAGRVAQTSKALLLPPDAGSQPDFRKLLCQAGATSALCLPLMASQHLFGVLDCRKTRPGSPFSHEDLELLSMVCSLATMTIQSTRLLAQCQEEKQRSKALMRQIILAQEKERRRISLEIHDGAAQWVVGASYHAQAARAALPKNPTLAQDHLEATHRVLNQTIKEMRLVVGDLHGPNAEGTGLKETLKEMLSHLETKSGLRCKAKIHCQEEVLSPETRITIYRIAQEALRNVQKHAHASLLEFLLSQEGGEVVMSIVDDGRGFSLPAALERASKIGHVGLLGIKERAEALGGAALVTTQPGQGTRIGVRLPLAVSPALPRVGNELVQVLRI